MPSQRNPRTSSKTTPTSRTTGGRASTSTTGPKPNGRTGNGGNGKPAGAWPISIVIASEAEIAIEGEDSTVDGFSICTRCAALLPGSEISRKLHERHHEQIDSHDAR